MRNRRFVAPLVLSLAYQLAACGGSAANDDSTRAPSSASSGGEQASQTPSPSASNASSAAPVTDTSATTASSTPATPLPASTADRPHELPGTSIRFEGGDGTSADQPIVIVGAQGETDGTRAEYQYIGLVYGRGGAPIHMRSQALLVHNGHHLDMLRFEQGGIEKEIYFDIEQYFGHF